MESLTRFLDITPAATRRRANRLQKRAIRKVAKQNTKRSPAAGAAQARPSRRRTKRLPCCGKERRYCTCGAEVDHMLDTRAQHVLIRDTLSKDLLTSKDPKDMSYILGKLRGRKMSIHCFMFHAALFRMYSKDSTYEALSKHAGALQPGVRKPDWAGLQQTLAHLYREPGCVWGGMFYPATLRRVKLDNDKWKVFSNISAGGAVQPAVQAEKGHPRAHSGVEHA